MLLKLKIRIEILNDQGEVMERFESPSNLATWHLAALWLRRISRFIDSRWG